MNIHFIWGKLWTEMSPAYAVFGIKLTNEPFELMCLISIWKCMPRWNFYCFTSTETLPLLANQFIKNIMDSILDKQRLWHSRKIQVWSLWCLLIRSIHKKTKIFIAPNSKLLLFTSVFLQSSSYEKHTSGKFRFTIELPIFWNQE